MTEAGLKRLLDQCGIMHENRIKKIKDSIEILTNCVVSNMVEINNFAVKNLNLLEKTLFRWMHQISR